MFSPLARIPFLYLHQLYPSTSTVAFFFLKISQPHTTPLHLLKAMATSGPLSETARVDAHDTSTESPGQQHTAVTQENQVGSNGETDVENNVEPQVDISLPQNWSKSRKWCTILIIALLSLMVYVCLPVV